MQRLEVLARQLTAGAAVEDRTPLLATKEDYNQMYQRSIQDPEGFWGEMALGYHWERKFPARGHMAANTDVRRGPVSIQFFAGGTTNLSYNCLDRWVAAGRGEQAAIIWEGNDENERRTVSYRELLAEVNRLSNWLKSRGVKKGDAVTIYLPMVPELPAAMLACARVGAVHSVVFAGFSADSLAQRMVDCNAKVLLTATGVMRGSKPVLLKTIADDAVKLAAKAGQETSSLLCLEVANALAAADTPWNPVRDVWWHTAIPIQSAECPPTWLEAEDRSFLLYTSGSTGKPKGVVHCTGGYMVGVGVSCRYLYDMRPGDVVFTTADCGWITGHSYLAYGPLLCGCSAVIMGGIPTHPDGGRAWRMVERYKVRQFYTAPTLLRSLLQLGDAWPRQSDLSSLRVLASAGEPMNEHAWHWFHEVVGGSRCPVVDTWWQTETGNAMMSPLPCNWFLAKAGSAGVPFFGVCPVLLDPTTGNEICATEAEGVLALRGVWPGMMRTLHGDHERFESVYFAPYKGYYFTGDGARRDADGHYWITGRVDDVINVSGHRIGTAEVESSLTEHPDCAEAAVIGVDHALKGQAIYAFVTLRGHVQAGDAMRKLLLDHVRKSIGPFAVPEVIHWAPGLPKTRSGKIMRRVLRKIASGQEKELGDISTLAEPGVVEMLIKLRGK
ncbi:hypothetical protein HYH02_012418 [Chlamydomonas schloesseri]|uniref:Acetyl-coenzyme A synthetase n=1 Tax=Chlamydomonas schloesseri TaxID=2026947 RepID=A0A835TA48_9CHLO|nr:hypothetical protein HYH02_012418 [Chlamydomonas schloesseri]|eukprot:KAG2434406.1 hypothetical protein HYH02_012418 [Chlamydomonas schloesseri]